ncbi:MAG: ferrochelatase [Thermodesulfovibrionales bacterium]|nr:ferrochelatase [Thermodesulfovibrionales bacterium]
MIGVILLNLGGPDSLEAVKPFLYNLFSDRDIIKLGPLFIQKPIASLIANLRAKKTQDAYNLIGGKSPLVEVTNAQAKALEDLLNSKFEIRNSKFKTYVGMRYWHPYIEDALKKMYADGIRQIIAFPLYPHYSVTTSGSSIREFKRALTRVYKCNGDKKEEYCINCPPVSVRIIKSWFDHPLYIDALVEKIQRGISDFKERPVVLFSAHSLPKSFIDEGDPYANEIRGTIEAVTKKIDIDWRLSYQSKTGPVKWLEPTTEQMLHKLAQEGIKDVLVVPISFVSDHIETLYEIDMLYKDRAQKLGINLKRIESLNVSPKFIEAIADMVMTNVKKAGWV